MLAMLDTLELAVLAILHPALTLRAPLISLALRVPTASTTNPKNSIFVPSSPFATSRENRFCIHTMQVTIESSPLPHRYVPPPGAHA
jgi:hypothetical protein